MFTQNDFVRFLKERNIGAGKIIIVAVFLTIFCFALAYFLPETSGQDMVLSKEGMER